MAATFNFVFSTSRSTRFRVTAEQVSAAVGEIGFLLWTILALAFSLVVMAGFLA
jgi:hypothetical protein